MGFSTYDRYDKEWEDRDTGRTASFSRDDCDETCKGTDDCDCAEMTRKDFDKWADQHLMVVMVK